MDQLFDAAKALNSLLPERALRAAAAYIGEQLTGTEIQRADEVRCVELAGVFQRYESAGDHDEAIPVASGRGSSTLDFLMQEYLSAIDPAVRQVRSHYFGQDTAPFPDDYSAAAEWLDAARKSEEKLHKPTLEPKPTAEPPRMEYLRRKLGPQMGRHKAALDVIRASEALDVIRASEAAQTKATLDVIRASEAAQTKLEHATNLRGRARYEDAAGNTQFFGYGRLSPLHELAELILAVAKATGFREPVVIRYVLCGDEPMVERIQGAVRKVVGRVGDKRLDRLEVLLRIQAPDLSQADFQEIRTFIRQAWTPRYGEPPLRFEGKDRILRRLLIELGDDGGRRRRGFWLDLLVRWKEEVGEADATVAQLKMREQRLKRKLRQLEGETTS